MISGLCVCDWLFVFVIGFSLCGKLVCVFAIDFLLYLGGWFVYL